MIASSCPIGDKWQSKTLVVAISGPRSAIVKSVFDCRLLGVETKLFFQQKHDKCKLFPGALVSDCSDYVFSIFNKHFG